MERGFGSTGTKVGSERISNLIFGDLGLKPFPQATLEMDVSARARATTTAKKGKTAAKKKAVYEDGSGSEVSG